jgi:hypothetical protein
MTARLGRLIAFRPTPVQADMALATVFAVYGLGHVWLGWIPDEGRLRVCECETSRGDAYAGGGDCRARIVHRLTLCPPIA